MQKTKIEYLTHTWNPIAMKCTPVSAGCKNCWHLKMAKRLSVNETLPEYKRFSYYGTDSPVLDTEELEAPLRLKKPSRIGVQFMGDLFHENISNDFIDKIFSIMSFELQHTFIVLTKRPLRATKWFNRKNTGKILDNMRLGVMNESKIVTSFKCFQQEKNIEGWPLPNVWFGVSVENQQTADERTPLLLQIPAAKRFASFEPALGDIDFKLWDAWKDIDWIIAGKETGHQARAINLDWMRSVKDQCQATDIPFFYKNGLLDGKEYHEYPKVEG